MATATTSRDPKHRQGLVELESGDELEVDSVWRSIIPNKTTASILDSFTLPNFVEPPRRRAASRSPVPPPVSYNVIQYLLCCVNFFNLPFRSYL